MDFRVPLIVLMVSFSSVSILWTWDERDQTGAQYSATLYDRAIEDVLRTFAEAPQDVPAIFLTIPFLFLSLLAVFSICCL